ncbi:hypothetical protein [Lactobacillus panisapium]|uniref:hypothetical protein n=1 Tax=Lactobacillus panisapium TaxID=2012495 RepID=UPI000CDADFB8|nr:hypothetical protein [Lactobacillus panisapium]
MKISTNLLTIIYGTIMIIAAVASIPKIPVWLTCLNVIASVFLILTCLTGYHKYAPICLFAILLIALINGYCLNGKINWLHWFIRLTITIALSWLNWCF